MMRLALLLAVVTLPAFAQERSNELRLELGVASAVGYGGVTYTRHLGRIDLEAGVGRGASGTLLSLMPHVRFGEAFVTGLGVELSVRKLDATDVGAAFHSVGTGVWLTADAGVQHTFTSGVALAGFLGATCGVRGNYLLDTYQSYFGPEYRGIRGLVAPQARLGVGYAF